MPRPLANSTIFANEVGSQPASQLDTWFSNIRGVINDSSSGWVNYVNDTGGSNSYVVTLNPPPSGYVAGFAIVMNPSNSNTGASTINVNSLGSVAIQRSDATPVQGGDIIAGTTVTMVYNGTAFLIQRVNPLATPSAPGLFPGIYAARLWVEDFTTLLPSTSGSAAVLGGQLGWLSALAGANTTIGNSSNGVDSINQASGVWGVSTGSTAAGLAGAALNLIPPALGQLDIFFRIAFSSIPTAAQNTTHRVGITDSVTTYANAVLLDMTFDGANASWQGKCIRASSTSGTGTATTPSIIAVTNLQLSFYRVQISINAAWNSVSFFVNGIQIGSAVTTNIPNTSNLSPVFVSIKTNGVTPAGLSIDDFWMNYQYATP